MRLTDELPVDHHLTTVYRVGAALCGALLLAFGGLGFADRLSPFDTAGAEIAGLTTNGLLSLVSVLTGLLLLGGAVVGGNVASTLNMLVGAVFVASGFVHLAVLDGPANILGFGMSNVIFSFVMGLLILTFGMYGRVSGGLPPDNPYWRRRHPEQQARERAAVALRSTGATGLVVAGGGRAALPSRDSAASRGRGPAGATGRPPQ